jgi:hypothetical protein
MKVDVLFEALGAHLFGARGAKEALTANAKEVWLLRVNLLLLFDAHFSIITY